MDDLEPTSERVALLRMADDGRLYRDSFGLFILGATLADVDDAANVLKLQAAGLIGPGHPDAWVRFDQTLVRQWDATDDGREWLVQAGQEVDR